MRLLRLRKILGPFFAILLLADCAALSVAQNYTEGDGSGSADGSDINGGTTMTLSASMDGNNNLFAYAEMYISDWSIYYDDGCDNSYSWGIDCDEGDSLGISIAASGPDMNLYDYSGGGTDVSVSVYGTGSTGNTYQVSAAGQSCLSGFDMWGDYEYGCSDVDDISLSLYAGPAAPNIDSSDPSGGTVGDSRVSITIYGENLTNLDGSAASLGFSPSGQVSFDNVAVVDSGTLSATYSIDCSVTPVLGAITAQTDGGSGQGPDFTVNAGSSCTTVPSATVTIDPTNWQAGWTNKPVTISGSNWGGNPTASVDVGDITLDVSPDANGNLSGTVTIPSTETATQANVTVTFGAGYNNCSGSNCYMPSGGNPPSTTPQPATGTAAIATAPPTIAQIDPQEVNLGAQGVQITITGSGFGASPTVSLPNGLTQTGIGGSSSTIVVTVNAGYTTPTSSAQISVTAGGVTSNSVPIMLNGPASATVEQDFIGAGSLNPNGQSRYITYQVNNIDQTPASNLPIAENISFSGYNCAQPNPGHATSSCNGQNLTSATGQFTDEWAMYTGYTPASCGETTYDHWQWCAPPPTPGSNPTGPNPGITFMTVSVLSVRVPSK